jgi:hypothetical protein
MLQIAIFAVILTAIPRPPQDQGLAQKDAHVQATLPPPDSITVPDGTPLTLNLENEVSSATAKVGDTVAFTTAHSARIDRMVIVPKIRIATENHTGFEAIGRCKGKIR